VKREIDTDRFPERQPFLDAVQQRGPHAGAWCEAWTVRVAWTGRTMKAPWFAEHMREELVLHGWDITGDDAAAQARLAEHWMTTHSVLAVGKPLLAKGVKQLRPGERIEAWLRVAGADDVVVDVDADGTKPWAGFAVCWPATDLG
jgi:hypothetical protein